MSDRTAAPMRICLLTDQELDADPFPENDWPCDPRPFMPEADWDLLTLEKDAAVAQVIEASRKGYDVFFNLCDGAWDEGRVGIEVVEALLWLNVPFTGATPEFFEPSREAMKRVCRAHGIDTPEYVVARTEADIREAADTLRFPLFVKHPSSYASNGLTRESRVENAEQLGVRARENIGRYGAALIEEFIEGTEYTVLVTENAEDPASPIVYRPLEYRFPEGESFKHYDLKWVHYDGLVSAPVPDGPVERRLRDLSGRFFVAMRGAGFGRCDFRADREGRPFLLEINPNCGIYYPPTDPGSADLCLLNEPDGHAGFTRALIDAAFARHARRQRAWEVRPVAGRGYGLFATRVAGAGDLLVGFEGARRSLVTQSYAEAHFEADALERLHREGWPLSDEVWIRWDEDPESWMPVNHSCDPSAWVEGLDLVARRAIAAGEEITLDYATCRDERMPSFECGCRSRRCRGTVTGRDYLHEEIKSYGDHLTEHIKNKRRAARLD